ncbi:MAG: hypothetical protein QOI06_1807, partial [Nocardioidaceae bacterium]|nr:hypothetical protein [Nocardioidaceae bacterium]
SVQVEPEVLCMRKVVAYELLSLDGVAESPDEFFTSWDEAMESNLAAVRRAATARSDCPRDR